MAGRLQALLPVGEVPIRLFARSHRSDSRKKKPTRQDR
jgi:hypothetical protein